MEETAQGKKALILGRGGFGVTLGELLAANGYTEVAFLDDAATGCVGMLEDYRRPELRAAYPYAFVGIGSNALRAGLLQKLAAAGYETPVFVHPAAAVSPSAVLGAGTVVLPFAYVGAGAALGGGCIINAGAIIDHGAVLGLGAHAAPGSIVKAGAAVPDYAKVESGEIVHSPWEK